MTKLTITAIGTPKDVKTRYGVRQSNYIKAKEMNDKFLNYFVSETTKDWAIGKEIEVESVEERQYTSKKDNSLQTSYDIKLPRFGGNGDVMKALEEIKNNQTKHHLAVIAGMKEIYEAINGKPKSTYPTPESQGITKMPDFSEVDDGLDQMNVDEFQGM